ncbi:MAG: sigma-54-dependent Fis family transcriptional regulator [Bdellovibrio sp.]|nr:sigma-54-dependent Fis family transcriptional regulator [Bdellovibrio sp.]
MIIKLMRDTQFMEMVHFVPSAQRRFALLAAQADSAPVLIDGGSGTGKSAIARWIHSCGPRAAKIFLVATPETPLAHQIMEAQGGTLMIPELGKWPLSEQKVLLGYLKTKTVPLPSSASETQKTPRLVNVRVIGTTSQNLQGRAQGGLFNTELLEKLNVFRIEMPPLARRMEEFEDIVLGIVGEITRELHKEYLRNLSKEAWDLLRSYDWPGNLREIRNVLHLAVASAKGDQIEVSDLPEFGYTRVDFRATREEFEKTYILELLKTFDWDIEKTCRVTRTDKSILLSKIKHYGISLNKG